MRLFLYKLLTQAIIILGRLRSKLHIDMTVRVDRTFRDPPHMFSIECCDCDLTHRVSYREGVRYQQPIRPTGYDYGWRRLSEPSPDSEEIKHQDEW